MIVNMHHVKAHFHKEVLQMPLKETMKHLGNLGHRDLPEVPVRETNITQSSFTSLITEARHQDIIQQIVLLITAQSTPGYFLHMHYVLGNYPLLLADQPQSLSD